MNLNFLYMRPWLVPLSGVYGTFDPLSQDLVKHHINQEHHCTVKKKKKKVWERVYDPPVTIQKCFCNQRTLCNSKSPAVKDIVPEVKG